MEIVHTSQRIVDDLYLLTNVDMLYVYRQCPTTYDRQEIRPNKESEMVTPTTS